MNNPQKPKIDNNALFAQRLLETPPEYNLGECVKYVFKKGASGGIGYISGRTYTENEKMWKYVVKEYSLNVNFDDVTIIGKHIV